jgi:drug/metabolite transporter (DMT)-like permease
MPGPAWSSWELASKERIARHAGGLDDEFEMAIPHGPLLVVLFCVSQAVRDVYFSHAFQGVDFFLVLLLSSAAATAIFGTLTAIRAPGEFAAMRVHFRAVVAMNVTTALAWSCYFFGLTHLEPAIVNTVHTGMGPLTVVGLAALGIPRRQRDVIGRTEYGCYAGIAVSLAGLCWVVLSGNSGRGSEGLAVTLGGLALLSLSGVSITVSLLCSKHLSEHGLSSEALTAVRYVLMIVVAIGVEVGRGQDRRLGTPGELLVLTLAGIALIVLPTFVMQAGVARTSPLTAHVIRSLGPVGIFALEQVDGRLAYAPLTLAGVLAYSGFVIAGNFARGWRDDPGQPPAVNARAGTFSGMSGRSPARDSG